MNLSPSWLPFLANAGVDAVHWSSVGRPDATDATIMAWARTNDCVVFTNDLDFSVLLAMTRAAGPSVLQLRMQDLLPDAAGEIVREVLRNHRYALLEGAIVTVGADGTRVRVLPLRPES